MKTRKALFFPLAFLVSCQQETLTGASSAGTTTISPRVERANSVTDSLYQAASTVTIRLHAGSYDQTQSHSFSDRGCNFDGVPIGAAYRVTFTGLDKNATAIWGGADSGTTAASGTSASTSSSVVTVPVKAIVYGNLTDSRDGKSYRTVTIGQQTWMAQNLNWAGAGACYSSNADSCAKYGRSYTWAEAMGVSSVYDTALLNATLPRQGACPDGWHVSSYDEWTTLEAAVGEYTAATQLKSTSGWASNSNGISGNGTDAYGFQVLPFGARRSDGTFNINYSGWFWTATESNRDTAWGVFFVYNDSEVHHNNFNTKDLGFSLRCLKGTGAVDSVAAPVFSPGTGTYTSAQTVAITSATSGAAIYYTTDGSAPTISSAAYTGAITVSSSKTLKAIAVKSGMAVSAVASATYTISTSVSTTIPWNSSVTYGSLMDPRDSKSYRTVIIGSQRWMAENLNYAGAGGVCYGNSSDSCSKYGRLYTWAEAMGVASTYNKTSLNATLPLQGACPKGWHVPSDAEWRTLEVAVGMAPTVATSTGDRGTTEGDKLKSTVGWTNNGTDDYGFRVLPAGDLLRDGSFDYIGEDGAFWTVNENGDTLAWDRDFYDTSTVGRGRYSKTWGFSMRCLEDSGASVTSATPAGMRLISGGTFTMGSPTTEPNRFSNETQHSVTLSSFYMDTIDVTQGQYQALMGVNPSNFSTCGTTCPVENVTWFDAVLYCNARSKQAGLDTVYSYTGMTGTYGDSVSNLTGITATLSKNGYRLPTEAQWEYAARGGTGTTYYWGDDTSATTVSQYAWYMSNSGNISHPVAAKPPNSNGLYDMAGNVCQWANDWYADYSAAAATDPSGPQTGSYKIFRGGAWSTNASFLRSANHNAFSPSGRGSDLGFRCVRPIS